MESLVVWTKRKIERFEWKVLWWYRELRKVGQWYDNYEQERTKNMIIWKKVFFIECISLCLQ